MNEQIDNAEWVRDWETINSQIKEGVNPYAYRLGWLKGREPLAGLTNEEVNQVGEWIKSETKTLVFDYVSKNRILQSENERLKAELAKLKGETPC